MRSVKNKKNKIFYFTCIYPFFHTLLYVDRSFWSTPFFPSLENFTIYFTEVILAMNSLRFCLKSLHISSLLKDNLSEYKILGLFFFNTKYFTLFSFCLHGFRGEVQYYSYLCSSTVYSAVDYVLPRYRYFGTYSAWL